MHIIRLVELKKLINTRRYNITLNNYRQNKTFSENLTPVKLSIIFEFNTACNYYELLK